MKKIILIDGFSLLYKAYYATAFSGNILRNSKGQATNMVYGFAAMLNKLMKNDFSHILVAFDVGKKTFRHREYPEYKAGRRETPEELISQIPLAKELVDKLQVSRYEKEGFEADDIIGTLAKKACKAGYKVDIYTGDKDLLQLISNNITVNISKRGISEVDCYDEKLLKEKMKITPKQVLDLKGLMGDQSDNLPGIKGVGEKTALKLLEEYQDLETIIENKEKIKGKLGEKIQKDYQMAILCKKLATIVIDGDFDVTLDETEYNGYDTEKLNRFYQELEFKSLIQKTEEMKIDYTLIDENNVLDINKYLIDESYISLELDDENYHCANILGLSIINDSGIIYLPFELFEAIGDWLANPKMKKRIFDLKRATVALKWRGFEINGADFDLMLASYVVNSNTKDSLFDVASSFDYFGCLPIDTVFGKGSKRTVPDKRTLMNFSIKNALTIKELHKTVLEKIEKEQIQLFNLEMDLAVTLSKMELEGVCIDLDILRDLKVEFKEELSVLTDKIYDLADEKFNINSPKQLGVILFEKLNLKGAKKTKSGYSTNVNILEKLINQHPIIENILKYRKLSRLVSTNLDGIEKVVISRNGLDKVHTIFKQAETTTGRLSSVSPNLQNIPIKTEEGRLIRKFFVSKNDNVLIGADYSQIELRVLASMSNTEDLINAFNNDKDIHRETAMKIFKVAAEEVTSMMRRQAKAVNFGIIYGQGGFGLAQELGIGIYEAEAFIKDYYYSFKGILEFLNKCVTDCKELGYAKTILNRKRYITEINSSNGNIRAFGERTAKNAPIQGSAADIIKKAMVEIDQEMTKLNLKSKLIIQIHDELIFDCCQTEVELMKNLIVKTMENAVELKVPLKVDLGVGKNLYELK